MMSETALRDLNAHPIAGLEKKSDGNKGGFTKSDIENSSEILEKSLKNISASLSLAPVKEIDLSSNGTNGTGNGISEVEYIESKYLLDLASVDASLSTLLERLDAKDWILVCEALKNVRQISLYHKEKLLEMLGDVIPLVVKSLKSPRSAVCKTALMTCADIFRTCSDSIIDSLDPMLLQLLLKASQDKRFVCEAAEVALVGMTSWVSPSLLMPKLLVYLKHKNPRIRAKTSMCFSRTVSRLGTQGIGEYGIDNLLQIAASQLSDQLPESREAARTLAVELQTCFRDSQASLKNEEKLEKDTEDYSWESFCLAKLSPLNANAILRVTSAHKEGC